MIVTNTLGRGNVFFASLQIVGDNTYIIIFIFVHCNNNNNNNNNVTSIRRSLHRLAHSP